jgi:hypothetical protein
MIPKRNVRSYTVQYRAVRISFYAIPPSIKTNDYRVSPTLKEPLYKQHFWFHLYNYHFHLPATFLGHPSTLHEILQYIAGHV